MPRRPWRSVAHRLLCELANDGEEMKRLHIKAGPNRECFVVLLCVILGSQNFASADQSGPASADQSGPVDEIIQELFLGETVYPQERYELQMSGGLQWRHTDGLKSFEMPLLLELGLTSRLQVELGMPVVVIPAPEVVSGAGNIEMGALYNVYRDRSREFALSLGVEAMLPSLSSRVGQSAYTFEPFLIAYKALGPIYANVSGSVEVSFPTQGETEVGGDLAVGLFKPFGALVPVFEFALAFEDEGATVQVAPGLIWHPGYELEVGLAVAIDLSEAANRAVLFTSTWEMEFGDEDDE